MDWGLCERLPQSIWELVDVFSYAQKKMFLREKLMFPSLPAYYFCIVIDLILRFFWVLSLLPPATLGGLIGTQLSFFLGSVEIARRSMWGILRVEFEHLKLLNQRAPGFLSNAVLHNEKLHDHSTHTDEHEEGISMTLLATKARSTAEGLFFAISKSTFKIPLKNATSPLIRTET